MDGYGGLKFQAPALFRKEGAAAAAGVFPLTVYSH